SVVIQVALIDTLAQSSISARKNYHHVVRKMLPDAAGTFVPKRNWQQGDSLLIELGWDVSSYPVPLDLSRLRIVVFVQDYLTKEVYQANYYKSALPKRANGIGKVTGVHQTKSASSQLVIFPNPVIRDQATILLPSVLHGVLSHQIRWVIADLQGRTLQRGHWASHSKQHVIFLDELPAGAYLLKLHFKKQMFQGRFIKKE
ncbi:MAG TPA: hypothetical protein DCS93_27740, partial [Microscillaceae bacterium]|nr:hypothetical protein [Microscillaceae bacterium]